MRVFLSLLFILICLPSWAEPKTGCGPVPPGSAFDSNCKLQVKPPPGWTLASDNQVFYDLHQAIGYLEAFKSGRCPTAKVRADQHLHTLASAEKHIASQELRDLYERLRSISENLAKQSIASIETFRKDLHTLAESHGWQHEFQWHQDFRRCEP